MNETKAATTAAQSARMTASLSNCTRSVNTSAELATMASTSNADSRAPPGLRLPRRKRTPRVESVMCRLYRSQVTKRVDHCGDSASPVPSWLLHRVVEVDG